MAQEIKVQITAETAQLLGQLSQAAGRLQEWARSANTAGASASAGFQAAGNAAQGFTGAVVKGGIALGTLRAALNGLRDGVTQVVDAYVRMDAAQRTLQFATGDGAASMAFVRRVSQELGLELVSTSRAFGQIAAAAKGSTLEGEPTRKLFQSVASAAAVMGLSADDTAGALKALGQMISKGKVQAEELRGQLGERLPGAFQIAARAMGVTTQQLDKMLQDGKVIANDFLPKFARELKLSLGDAPQAAAQSFQAQVNRIKNAWTDLLLSVGNSGILQEAAGGMKALVDAVGSAEGRRSVAGFGATLSDIFGVLKSTTGFLVEHRSAIMAVGVAYGAVKIAQTVSGWASAVQTWITRKTAALAVTRAAALQEVALAQAEVTSTAAALANAEAHVVRARALLGSAAAARHYGTITAILTAQEAAVTTATNAHAVAQTNLARAQAASSVAARGSAAIYAALGGPIGLATIAVGGLVAILMKMHTSKAEAAANARAAQEAALGEIRTWGDQIAKVRELDDSLRAGNLTKEQAAIATQRLQVIQGNLIQQYPGLIGYLKDEAGNTRSLAEALQVMNAEKLKTAEMDAKGSAASVKSLEALVAQRKQWIAYGEEKDKTSFGVASDKLQAKLDYNRRALQTDQEMLERQKRLAKEAGEAYEALAAIQSTFQPDKAGGSGTKPAGKPKENVYAEELIKLREKALRYEDDATLATKQRIDLERVDLGLMKEKDRIQDLLKGKKLEPGQALELTAKAEQDAASARLAVKARYAREAEKIDQETQNRLELLEEQGYARKAASMKQAFDKANEDRKKAGLQAMESAGLEANLEALKMREVDREAGKLTSGLRELAEEKGRALSFTEQMVALDALAKKLGIELPESIARARQEIQTLQVRSTDASGGFAAGLESYINQLSDRFSSMKAIALQLAQSMEGAFSNFFTGIIQKGTTAGQKWDALWKGLSGSVVKALSDMAAKEVMLWTTQKAKSIWDTANTGKKIAEANAETTANIGTASSGFFKAHSWIPWVGAALAIGFIAMMMSQMSSVKGRAIGGVVKKPELTLLGEAGPEVVAPEAGFKEWAADFASMGANLAMNIANQQTQARGYQAMGAGYAQAAASQRAEGGSAMGGVTVHGNIITMDSREFDAAIKRGLDRYQRANG